MYSVSSYGNMIRDQLRLDAYHQALKQVVRPGDVVIDIGTGSGIHALLACQFGASRVYAIEPAKAINIAKEIAQDNGYGDRIHFIQDLSTNVTLPELGDVIVSDLHGIMPWFYQHIPSLIDARQRLLKPGGTLLPLEDELWGGIVEAPELYESYVCPWNEADYGFDLKAGMKITTNTWGRGRAAREQFLTEPQPWAKVNYTNIDTPNMSTELEWIVRKAGTGHGLMLWFDTTVTSGVHLTSAPYKPEISYGSAFFPWIEPVSLQSGDRIHIKLRADLTGQDYTWSWKTAIYNKLSDKVPQKRFHQSTFFSELLSLQKLKRRSATYRPKLKTQGELDALVLQKMDGSHNLQEIAAEVMQQFPNHFQSLQSVLHHVQELSDLYG